MPVDSVFLDYGATFMPPSISLDSPLIILRRIGNSEAFIVQAGLDDANNLVTRSLFEATKVQVQVQPFPAKRT